ncbi:MAG: ester cyclase [Proteobacteria bacterium]|nr:ester cyclase [Pseudomonadota bacterium]
MSVAAHEALIRRWIALADRGFDGDFGEFFVPDYAGHVSGRLHMDLAELERLERGFAAAFSGTRRTIEDLWGAADKMVLRLTTRARHTGEFNGIAATQREIVMTALVIYRFRDGRIAESWGELDFAGLWRQLTAPAAG